MLCHLSIYSFTSISVQFIDLILEHFHKNECSQYYLNSLDYFPQFSIKLSYQDHQSSPQHLILHPIPHFIYQHHVTPFLSVFRETLSSLTSRTIFSWFFPSLPGCACKSPLRVLSLLSDLLVMIASELSLDTWILMDFTCAIL